MEVKWAGAGEWAEGFGWLSLGVPVAAGKWWFCPRAYLDGLRVLSQSLVNLGNRQGGLGLALAAAVGVRGGSHAPSVGILTPFPEPSHYPRALPGHSLSSTPPSPQPQQHPPGRHREAQGLGPVSELSREGWQRCGLGAARTPSSPGRPAPWPQHPLQVLAGPCQLESRGTAWVEAYLGGGALGR